MKIIGKNTISILDGDIKQYILLSPVINDISNKNGIITIHSEEFGSFSFISTRKYLENNKKALELINNYLTKGYCHQMSWEAIKHLENANLLTSLLPAYFEGNYYHTVIRNQDSFIIDIANEAVFDDETRDFLFKGNIVTETEKDNLENKLREAIEAQDEESKQKNFAYSMLLTLHAESKKYH